MQTQTTQLTPATLKNMAETPELIQMTKTIFMAIAYMEAVAKIVEPKQQELIDFWKPKVIDKFRAVGCMDIVTKWDHLYLASDQDSKIIFDEINAFFIEAGFKVKPGYCPLLIAQGMVRDAKKMFVDLLEPYTGLSFDVLLCSGLENYKKYVDLNLSLFAGKVKI